MELLCNDVATGASSFDMAGRCLRVTADELVELLDLCEVRWVGW